MSQHLLSVPSPHAPYAPSAPSLLTARPARAAMVASLTILAAGCGGGAANDLSQEDAYVAAEAIGGSTRDVSSAGGYGAAFIVQNVSVSESVPCPAGGSMDVTGSAEVDANTDVGAPGFGGQVVVAVDVIYQACGYADVVIDGGVSSSIEASFSGAGAQLTAAITGTASFSGRFTGSCDVDMQLDPDTTGGSFDYAGTICGYDLAELESNYEGSVGLGLGGGLGGGDLDTCSGGGCTQVCADGEHCTKSCSGGDCTQRCEAGSTCTLSCSGAGCEQICESGAECELTCSGGFCAQTCAGGSSCTTSCSGLFCS